MMRTAVLLFSWFFGALCLKTPATLLDTVFGSRLARDYVNTLVNPPRAAFGFIEYTHIGTTTFTTFCEGAVLRPDVILSVKDCQTTITLLTPKNQYEIYFKSGSTLNRHKISKILVRENFILLEVDSAQALKSFTKSNSPILTWVADKATPYKLPFEMFTSYGVYFAPTTRGVVPALTGADFVDKSDRIALKMASALPKTFHPGAAFYKYVKNRVVLMGLYSETASANCHTRGKNSEAIKVKKQKTAPGTYVCGYMMTQERHRGITNVANILGNYFFADDKIFPNNVIVGSLNMLGIAKMKRDLGDKVAESLVNVIAETQIFALQEASNLQTTNQFTTAFNNKFPTGANWRKAVYNGQFALVYDPVAFNFQNCLLLSASTGGSYALDCTFQTTGVNPAPDIHFVNCHFSYGKKADRVAQEAHLEARIKASTAPYVVLGDFNIKKNDQETEVQYFYQSHFTDYGPTSMGDNHFDRILLLENYYLYHEPYFPKAGGGIGAESVTRENLEKAYKNFYPLHPTLPPFNEPTVCAYEISDHLPVQFTIGSIKVATWNLRNYNLQKPDPKKVKYIPKVLQDFDLVAVQELYRGTNGSSSGKTLEVPPPPPPNSTYPAMDQAFYYDSKEVSLTCHNVYFTSTGYRPAFFCTVQSVKNIFQMFHIANLHVMNKANGKPNSFAVLTTISDEVKNHYNTMGLTGSLYLVGDLNMDFKTNRIATSCTHENHKSYTFTRISSKTLLDHVIEASVASLGKLDKSGVPGCTVYDYQYDTNVIGSRKNVNAKAFCTWEEISDHYPVFAKITVPAKQARVVNTPIWP